MNEQKSLLAREHHLHYRRANKLRILEEGGEQALSHSQNDIKRIDFALKRLEEGQYGLCCNCGLPIDPNRLDIIPETPLCFECAEEIFKTRRI